MGSKLSQRGGGIFMTVFKGTFGYLGAMIVYFLIFLVFAGLFSVGAYLYSSAKSDICKEYKEEDQIKRRCSRYGNCTETTKKVKVCVDEGSISDSNSKTQTKYYSGIVMMIIFGLLALIMILPYIIQGLSWGIGSNMADSLF